MSSILVSRLELALAEAAAKVPAPSGAATDDDWGVPIAALKRELEVTAVPVVGPADDPRFHAGDEIPITLWPGDEAMLRLEQHPAGVPVRTWRELRIECRNEHITEHWPQPPAVVVASYPYSTGWVEAAPLKPRNKQQPETVRRRALDSADAHQYLVDLPRELTESRSGWLVARLGKPMQAETDIVTGKRWKTHAVRLPHFPWRRILKPSWVFGMCPDVEAFTEGLLHSSKLQTLLSQAHDGTLFEHTYEGVGVSKQHEVEDDVKARAEELLRISAMMALAGPEHDADSWKGKPVADLVETIFVPLLYNLNRRARDPGGLPRRPSGERKDLARAVTDAEQRLDAELAKALERYAIDVLGGLDDATDARARYRSCIMAAALRRVEGLATLIPRERLATLASEDPDGGVRAAAEYASELVEDISGKT